MRYIIFTSVLFSYALAFSQDQHPMIAPGRTINAEEPKSYTDSENSRRYLRSSILSLNRQNP